MSVRAMLWAFEQQCPTPAAKLVLIKLADHANDEGECWPAQGRVAGDCGLTRETVNRQVKALAAAGLLLVEQRINGVGQLPNRYVLRCDGKSQGCDLRSQGGVTRDHTNPKREPLIKNPPLSPQGEDDRFEEFYRVFPRKADRLGAGRAWRTALKRAPPEVIIAAASRYAAERAGQDKQFTKMPATWLNKGSWGNDEESADAVQHKPDRPRLPLTDEAREEILGTIRQREMGLAR